MTGDGIPPPSSRPHVARAVGDHGHRHRRRGQLPRRRHARRRLHRRAQPRGRSHHQPCRHRRRRDDDLAAGAERPDDSGRPRPDHGAGSTDHATRDVPAGRPGGQELPHHRRRQQRVRRPRLALRRRRSATPRAGGSASAATRSWCSASTRPTDRVAVLSFPRDLYVKIAGSNSKSRINSAYRRDDPQRLINTIYENFGIGIDHFIQVDFCAFKTLVDAVGGVTVPFDLPGARHEHRAQRADRRRAASRSTATTPSPTSAPATTSTRTRRAVELEDRRHVRPRTDLAPAGLPAPHAGQRARPRASSTRASLAG